MQTLQGSFLALVNGGPLAITKEFFKEQVTGESGSADVIRLVFDTENDYYRIELNDS